MSEMPWRNPRPARTLPEMEGRVAPPANLERFKAWLPALCWAAFIFSMSTDTFSAAHTGRILRPLLLWMFPHLSNHTFNVIHHFVRKSAHFTEYFIFGLFLYRGVRGLSGANSGWRWSWALTAWAIAVAYACLDEIHQSFVASRTASPYDSLLDSIGAAFAIATLFLYFRYRYRTLTS
jgi:VanZ family protein